VERLLGGRNARRLTGVSGRAGIGVDRRDRGIGDDRRRCFDRLGNLERWSPARRDGLGGHVRGLPEQCYSYPARLRSLHALTATTTPTLSPAPGSRWADGAVRLAIALAFADASVAVLALPQIVVRLHTSISHVTWVITAYNLALIASTLAVLPIASRLASRRALVAGLSVFGLASLGSGAAGSLMLLIVWRCVQGVGGALLLCASLPLLRPRAGGGAEGTAQLRSWAVAAAFGAGVGPSAGGVLTQIFDWRAIFFAQAPVAAAAAMAAVAGHLGSDPASAPSPPAAPPHAAVPSERTRGAGTAPALANLALSLISAGLIGALFLATILLINVWQLSPLGAAGVLAVIPLTTVITERAVTERPAAVAGAAGAVVLALGLVVLALVSHRMVGLALIALCLCGVGLGLAFPALTRVALSTAGPPVARAARTVAAREGGLVLGLVLLTPILVNQLDAAPARATPPIFRAIITAPLSLATKIQLGAGLQAASAKAPASELPDLGPPFARAAAGADPTTRAHLAALEVQVRALVQSAVTRGFRTPLLLCAGLSLLAIPALIMLRSARVLLPRRE
jgi:MFS family permease